MPEGPRLSRPQAELARAAGRRPLDQLGQRPDDRCELGRREGRERSLRGLRQQADAGWLTDLQVIRGYMIQPLVELYGGCMVVLKFS